ncbi:Amyloid-beta A4 precursor protein-binding A member 1 [Ameca splendens]|uniref:Amyloid-beta A4 protein-binding A member 1 n=1 Tax=Ameca splendens TaxID=208324 RepID=A0ABV0Y694_9TELE
MSEADEVIKHDSPVSFHQSPLVPTACGATKTLFFHYKPRTVFIEKVKGEILGVVIVESGWGSILPTVIIANMMHAGPAERSGKVNIGDQIMSVNGTSLIGLPLSTCQSIIKGLKDQSQIKLNIVRCPPVTTVLIRRPDVRYQLGFSVQNGIICSLMRGGIAERGGVRVGHRIIEINSQSVVATPHETIVQILSKAVGQIHMKTMPAAMYRLLTAQEQPLYI